MILQAVAASHHEKRRRGRGAVTTPAGERQVIDVCSAAVLLRYDVITSCGKKATPA